MEEINFRQLRSDTQTRSIGNHTGTQIYTLKKSDIHAYVQRAADMHAPILIYVPLMHAYVSVLHMRTHTCKGTLDIAAVGAFCLQLESVQCSVLVGWLWALSV